MKVEGLRILDSNYYQQITIHNSKMVVQRYDKVGRLITKDFGPKRASSKQRLSLEIKNLDDVAVVDAVTDYYLNYSKINAIFEDIYVEGILYPVVVDSTLGKRLRFRTCPSDEVVEKIMAKYRFDRDEFLVGLDEYKNFVFGHEVGKSYYEIKGEKVDESKKEDKSSPVIFCLAASHDENFVPRVRDDELEFFGRAISIIMGDSIAKATVVEDQDRFGFITKNHVIFDIDHYERQIHMPEELYSAAEKFVSEHNHRVWEKRREQEKIEGNVYQMKMEGF